MKIKPLTLEDVMEVLMDCDIIHTPLVGMNHDTHIINYGICNWRDSKIIIDPRTRGDKLEYLDSHWHEICHFRYMQKLCKPTEEEIDKIAKITTREYIKLYGKKR